MSGLKTKGVVKKSSGISKEIKPGNRTARIHSIELVKPSYATGEEYDVVLTLETEPITAEGFEGFDKVYGDPSKGKFLGQSSKVRGSQYTFKTTINKKSNEEWTLEEKVMGFLEKLSSELGNPGWLDSMDGKVNTIGELVKEFDRVKEFKAVYLNWCLGGKEKIKDGKYKTYYLYLPVTLCPMQFANPNGKNEVTIFDEQFHIKKDENAAPSQNFNSVSEDEEEISVDDDTEFATGTMDDDDDLPFDIDDDAFDIDED
jgi:hypothetical protein